MGIPDRILHKPGPLTSDEWETMRQHPQYACALLSPIDYLRPAKEISCCHHERWDGSGYPSGLKGDEIPLPARLFAVVDVYDALTSDRPYRSAWSKQAALNYIQEQTGILFDPAIVSAFLELIKAKEFISKSQIIGSRITSSMKDLELNNPPKEGSKSERAGTSNSIPLRGLELKDPPKGGSKGERAGTRTQNQWLKRPLLFH